MKIKRVILTNFRAFKNVQTIEFDDFNCIIGKNDVGKSSILVALDWFFGNRELSDIDINIDNIVKDSSGFVIGGDELSVEIDFEVQFDTDVPNFFSDENRHLYRKDFLDGNNLRIKKYYLHSSSHQLDNDYYVKKTGYYVFTKHYNSFGNRPLSFLAIEELKAEGSKIGQVFETIKANIQKDIELQKQNSPNDVALQNVIRLEELNIDNKTFEQICDDLSAHSNVNYQWDYEPIEDNSMDFILKSNGKFPKFRFFNAETPLNEYIKLLFSGTSTQNAQKEIDALKHNVAQQISSQVFPNGQSETFSFSPDYEYLANSILLSDKGIPLSNRGDGFQLRIKNAVFRLLSAQNAVSTQPMVFVFEEPETHLHPSAQIEMYETIQRLSETKYYQVVITSHSPYIVNALSENKTEIIVVKRKNDETTAKNIMLSSERILNYP
ncbi:MAG: ATP-binding protein, partial [Bacteroidales bacterium]|nr:ATP-binding protein [Bacteroidales bacterium]